MAVRVRAHHRVYVTRTRDDGFITGVHMKPYKPSEYNNSPVIVKGERVPKPRRAVFLVKSPPSADREDGIVQDAYMDRADAEKRAEKLDGEQSVDEFIIRA